MYLRHLFFRNNFRSISAKLCTPLLKKQILTNYCSNCSSKMGLPLVEIVNKLKDIAPLKLAESWDNVGVLVEPNRDAHVNTILLTIDLTEDVVDEAIENKAQLILSYHPNIFRPLKTVTQSHWKERIIVKCIKNDITVYSPHTTWDAMTDGVNDWLISSMKIKSSRPILANAENSSIGMGRVADLQAPITLRECIANVKSHIGLPHLRLGIGRNKTLESLVSSVAVCAGSGSSVLGGVKADVYISGEMLHHDVLEATQNGINVILCNHSDSERGFLRAFQKKIAAEGLAVIVSKKDKDCLETV